MPYKTNLLRHNSRPAKLLCALVSAGPAGMLARDYQRVGIEICGDKEKQMGTAECLTLRQFTERRVVITPAGAEAVARLLAKSC